MLDDFSLHPNGSRTHLLHCNTLNNRIHTTIAMICKQMCVAIESVGLQSGSCTCSKFSPIFRSFFVLKRLYEPQQRQWMTIIRHNNWYSNYETFDNHRRTSSSWYHIKIVYETKFDACILLSKTMKFIDDFLGFSDFLTSFNGLAPINSATKPNQKKTRHIVCCSLLSRSRLIQPQYTHSKIKEKEIDQCVWMLVVAIKTRLKSRWFNLLLS